MENQEIAEFLAGFREVPVVCLPDVIRILDKLDAMGLAGTVMMGEPNQPTLQIPVTGGYVGLVVLAGLNPLAAVEQAGIETQNVSMSMMMDFQNLTPLF